MKSLVESTDIFKILKPIAEMISVMFGNECEVVVHDITNIENSIVYIYNGHVTGRQVGDTITDLGLKQLRLSPDKDIISNYQSKTKDGKVLRCSTVLIRDDNQKTIAAMCVNYNITNLIGTLNVLQNLALSNAEDVEERYLRDINDYLDIFLEETIKVVGKPVSEMQKEDKIKAIRYLDSKGAFLVKKSVDRIAKFLDVSKFTIYNYIDEVRS